MKQKKDVEKYIAQAVEAVRTHLTTPEDNKKIPDVYDGYAAALGASIVTSGLKPALAFYSDQGKESKNGATDDKNKDKVKRHKILEAIVSILTDEPLFEGVGTGEGALLDFVVAEKNAQQQRQMKDKILAATIALKLALRNFIQVKTSQP